MAKPWRDSASLILGAGSRNLKFLLLQRKAGGSFSKSRVFPGGVLDPADLSPKWKDHFSSHGTSLEGVLLPAAAMRPPILETKPAELAREVALRITAVRETFEEAGILLANPRNKVLQNVDRLKQWRSDVMGNGDKFLDMCKELAVVPDVGALRMWSNWLSPIDLGGKRFDTIFFVAEGDEATKPDIHADEMLGGEWVTSSDALIAMLTGRAALAPPQMYEFGRLIRFRGLDELMMSANLRQKFGVQRWIPVRIHCPDGNVAILPGDDAYPAEPDFDGLLGPLSSEKTVKEMRQSVRNLHRIESDAKGHVRSFQFNITLEPQQCDPVNLFRNPRFLLKAGFKAVTSKIRPAYV